MMKLRRKMMKLRRMMLRRKTDPKTVKHTLGEPAQSKCTRTQIYKENAGRFSRGQRFVRACAVEINMDMSQEAFCAEICRENVTRGSLCGNLQGKCRTRIPRQAFASLRSRNAHGHVTRGILCRNLQGKCQTPRIPPRLNTGPQLLP